MAPGLRAQRVPMREREPHNTKAGGEEDGRRVAMEADEVRRKTGQLARRLAKELRSYSTARVFCKLPRHSALRGRGEKHLVVRQGRKPAHCTAPSGDGAQSSQSLGASAAKNPQSPLQLPDRRLRGAQHLTPPFLLWGVGGCSGGWEDGEKQWHFGKTAWEPREGQTGEVTWRLDVSGQRGDSAETQRAGRSAGQEGPTGGRGEEDPRTR